MNKSIACNGRASNYIHVVNSGVTGVPEKCIVGTIAYGALRDDVERMVVYEVI